VIQAIRSWIHHDPAAHTGWIGTLRDSQIRRALRLIHGAPAHQWTVAALDGKIAMSRSAFAARFTVFVGEPVMHYVARCRMHVPVTWIKTTTRRLRNSRADWGMNPRRRSIALSSAPRANGREPFVAAVTRT
jgi:AraC-like DNA-binding protein